MIYLDSAATSMPKPLGVYAAALRAMRRFASPGRGGHEAAMKAADAVYDCRKEAGELFGCDPEQVVFTMNATHALNIAIKTLAHSGDEVVISGFEHNAVVRPLYAVGADVRIAQSRLFDPDGAVRAFSEAITENTRAVVCTHVSNVFGYILPVDRIAELCNERGVPLIVDASQSAGILPVSLRGWNAAFVAMPGHKGLYGPQGTGILLCGRLPETLIEGGSGSLSELLRMPDFLPDISEAGTHNVTGVHALCAGIRFVKKRTPEAIFRHECGLRELLAERVKSSEGIHCFRDPDVQTGVLSVTADGMDCELIASELAQRKIAVRAGLHCAPTAHRSAGTLACGTVRFSFSVFNTAQSVLFAAEELKKIVKIAKKT